MKITSKFAILTAGALLNGCVSKDGSSYMVLTTGTTIGMKATPGDGNSQPPQFTVGYKRAEAVIIPTAGSKAEKTGNGRDKDTFSSLAAIGYKTGFSTPTKLNQVIATGFAADEAATNGAAQAALTNASGIK